MLSAAACTKKEDPAPPAPPTPTTGAIEGIITPANTLTFASLGKPEPEMPYDPKDYAQHSLGEVSRPAASAAASLRGKYGMGVSPADYGD